MSHACTATIAVALLLTGCLSGPTDDAPDGVAGPQDHHALGPGERFAWDWQGEAGSARGFFLTSGCPTDRVAANWAMEMQADRGDGIYWIIGPTPIVAAANPLVELRTHIGATNGSMFEENAVRWEAGEGLRVGYFAMIGAETAWTSHGDFGVIEATCAWNATQVEVTNASAAFVPMDAPLDSGLGGTSLTYTIPDPGWTHVILPEANSKEASATRFHVELPNGFEWADQNTREGDGGVSGAAARYVGSFVNEPGPLRVTWLDSRLDEQGAYVIHHPGLQPPDHLDHLGYCDGGSECRRFAAP